jgi:hypothetical protein
MNLFFWMLLNLGVPIIGPIFTLALVAPAHGWRVAKALIAASVKDGQLFWCASGLCACAAYEVLAALERGGREVPILALCMVGLCIMGFVCSVLVMLGSVNAYRDRMDKGAREGSPPVIVYAFSRIEVSLSVLLTLIAATLFAILHVHFS